MSIPRIYPIILSGGTGTRLWPLSRQLRPKQFLNIYGNTSMFAQTLERVNDPTFSAPIVVCNDDHRFLVAEELRQSNCVAQDIILEPAACNTAPAIAAAGLRLLESDANALMLILPSDHVISDKNLFRQDVEHAVHHAMDNNIVTFGVKAERPETGYGYILRGSAIDETSWRVNKFVEKPDEHTAATFVEDGNYLWNAGIFLFKASVIIDELKKYQPGLINVTEKAVNAGVVDLGFFRLSESIFRQASAISIDHAVMEKTDRARVIAMNSNWSDVGSWASLCALGEKDADGNVINGESIVLNSRNNYLRSSKPLVAAIGVENLVIVATDDAVLVVPRERAEDVKELVLQLDRSNRNEHISHTRVYRPWGYYQNLESGDGFLVKRISVNPGAKLSLQYHNYRAEHWIVVSGVARVTNGEEISELGPNQSTYIPRGTKHRLENPGGEPTSLIEVQTGDHISEDDIERLEDTYGRVRPVLD